jgi:hypothetical protein
VIRRTLHAAHTCARVLTRTLVRTPRWLVRHPAEVFSIALTLVIVLGTLDAYLTR